MPASELDARAQAAAARGEWNAAARALEELVAAGVDSSDVLFNLGTVDARAGRYGEAIWRLSQVERRAPLALDARQNLRAARLLLAHRDAARSGRAVVETATPLGVWLGELLPLDWSVTLTLLSELGALLCLLALRRGRAGEMTRVAAGAGAVLLATMALGSGAVAVARSRAPEAGIVLRDGLRVLRGPAADALAEGPVREGERVEILAREGAFVRVRTPAGMGGWLSSRDIGVLAE